MKGTEIKKYPFQVFGASIGFSFRYYVEGLVGNSKVKMLSINGVEPTRENIANNTYPITVNFYAVYRKDNNNENIKKVIDFILSEDGQYIINETGYVGIN
jgi:phosphate transport system substrate-binding protein